MWVGWSAGAVGAGITAGEILAGMSKKKMHWVIRFVFPAGGILLACMATCTPDTPYRAIILMLLGTTLIGANECLSAAMATICIHDQREIGTALGIGGSSRSFVSTLAGTVYTVVLSNRLSTTISEQVPSALVDAGLDPAYVTDFIAAYTNGTQAAFAAVQGLNPAIQEAGTVAYKNATADAYRTVFLTTIAFSAIGTLLTWLAPDVDKKLTREVTITLSTRADKDIASAEAGIKK